MGFGSEWDKIERRVCHFCGKKSDRTVDGLLVVIGHVDAHLNAASASQIPMKMQSKKEM